MVMNRREGSKVLLPGLVLVEEGPERDSSVEAEIRGAPSDHSQGPPDTGCCVGHRRCQDSSCTLCILEAESRGSDS